MTKPDAMTIARHKIRTRIENVRLLQRALRAGRRHGSNFRDVSSYCMFVGHPRSGHTLVKAHLNAHKNALIGQETNVLQYLQIGFKRWMLYSLILASDEWFSASGNTWGEYSYQVPNQWQGRYETLRIIGDKKAGRSTEILHSHPELLPRLCETVRDPVKIIHVIRNPYDNIATISRKHGYTLAESTAMFFKNWQTLKGIGAGQPLIPIHKIYLEAYVRDPATELDRLCGFLDLPIYPGFLEDCASIVFASPNKSRDRVEWEPSLVSEIRDQMTSFQELEGYSFED